VSRWIWILLCSSCALPVVTAGTFLPAGDLKKGDLHASVSFEAGRVLAGPADVHDRPATPPEAQQWEVSTWFASDASLRWQVLQPLSLEVQLKLTNPVAPFTPNIVGGAAGARLRLRERSGEQGVAIELAARAVGVAVEQRIDRTQNGRSQTDRWSYRAFGAELPLVATWRINPFFAATVAPFARLYFIRAWHTIQAGLADSQAVLQWQPVLSGGLGLSAALTLGPVEIAPGVAVELATRPGPNAPTRFLFEPGLSLGMRF
jgi:hypothetical protein